MNRIQKAALAYLAVLAVFAWGIGVGRYEVFPFGIFKEVVDFVRQDGDPMSNVLSDLDVRPERFLHEYGLLDASENYPQVDVEGLRGRRDPPRLNLSDQAPRGYRAIFGAFDFEETFWGGVLINPEGALVHQWHLSTDDLPGSTEPAHRKNMYGVAVLPDGSVIVNMQETSGGIVRVGFCGNRVWSLDGVFHHVVSVTDQGTFWTFEGFQSDFDPVLTLVDVETGQIVRRIDMKNVRAANPTVHIFDLQRGEDVEHAVHGNDIDPLPRRLLEDFPQFAHGDMLVSFRTINLVFVLDPATLEIKWWRIGPWDRQHDPDWNEGGNISVFDNNLRGVRDFSSLVTIDPETFEHDILVDGSEYTFYSSRNGRHQVTAHGTVLVTSSTQGRVFEVGLNGDVVFDFVNVYDARSDETLHLSDAFFLDPGFFQFDAVPECGGS